MRKALLSFVIILTAATAHYAQNPLPNPGFEDWTQYNGGLGSTFREPNNWNTSNQCSQILANYSVARTSDAHSGNYAAELKTKNAFGNIRINGLLTTSTVVCNTNSGGIKGGLASTLVPDSIVFWYKYAPVNVDTAYVQVILMGNQDTLSYLKGKIWTATSSWTRASFAIPTPTGTPDTISTLLNSSWGDGSIGQAFVGSEFIVDDIEFVVVTGIAEDMAAAAWEVYPNPVVDVLNVSNQSGQAGTIEIIDAIGRTVLHSSVAQDQTRLEVSTLPVGLYIYQLRNLRGEVIKTGKLLRGI